MDIIISFLGQIVSDKPPQTANHIPQDESIREPGNRVGKLLKPARIFGRVPATESALSLKT